MATRRRLPDYGCSFVVVEGDWVKSCHGSRSYAREQADKIAAARGLAGNFLIEVYETNGKAEVGQQVKIEWRRDYAICHLGECCVACAYLLDNCKCADEVPARGSWRHCPACGHDEPDGSCLACSPPHKDPS